MEYGEQQVDTRPEGGEENVASKSDVKRETPVPEQSRANLVSEWHKKIEEAKAHWKPAFDVMRKNMQLAYAGAKKEWIEAENYVVPIIARHINQVVSSLYAKNPQVVCEPKKRMDYVMWDGRNDTLQAALQNLAQALQPQIDPATGALLQSAPDPQAAALVQEVSEVQQRKLMIKRVCKTLEIVISHYLREQSQNFKRQLKQLVRRVKVCAVGYVFLGYQRLMEKRPDVQSQIADITAQLSRIESLSADLQDGLLEQDCAKREELKLMLEDLQRQVEVIVREGPVFDFPRSTEVLIDPKVKQINGLIGADWFSRYFFLSPGEAQAIYKIDFNKASAKRYVKEANKDGAVCYTETHEDKKQGDLCFHEVYCKSMGMTFTLAEGYPDFVKAPVSPEPKLERFWPLFVLTFNDVEHETKAIPMSDVEMLRHPQDEYNRSREMRRLHRKSNTPMYVSVAGRLSEADKLKLQTRPPFAVVELAALAPGEDAKALLQPFTGMPFDQAMYETNSEMEDVLRTVGAQEANIGGMSGGTATESSIAENSRMSALDSNIDDLDEMLSELVEATAQMLLLTLDINTVKRIAGPGAVWPQMSRAEIVEEVDISIKAGSSGRPNKAADLANLERGAPYLLQMDGVKSTALAEKYAGLLDIDTEELIVEGLPSQVALNSMAGKIMQGGAAGPQTDPASQGVRGAVNAPSAQVNEQGAQPAYPPPQAMT